MRGSDISSKATSRAACRARPDRFRLAGPTVELDRRVHAIRPDIADIALADRFFAPHYAAAQPMRCASGSVPLYMQPDARSRAVSELRYGDGFALLDGNTAWAWGYSSDDRYVGYVPADALMLPTAKPTHVVNARSALIFAQPDIKSAVVMTLPMGARILGNEEGEFVRTADGYIHQRHLRTDAMPSRDRDEEPAAIAESLLGTPYRWGGRSGFGIDCSGLVQLALDLTGHKAPRDSDQQRDALGAPIAADTPLRRNDLVFFPGHVGIMADADRLIHANAHAMMVTVEPLADVVARGAEIVARRRIEHD